MALELFAELRRRSTRWLLLNGGSVPEAIRTVVHDNASGRPIIARTTLATRSELGQHDGGLEPDGLVTDAVSGNIDAVAEFYAREDRKISRPRNAIERTSEFVGQPIYLGCIAAFVALWSLANVVAERVGWAQFDPPPFIWLQGIIGLFGLIVGTAVLIRQNRLARLAEQHAHLDLQVNLLTEQKTTKIIRLLEELRRDLPSVANRHDAEVDEMQIPADPHAMLHAIETKRTDREGGGQST